MEGLRALCHLFMFREALGSMPQEDELLLTALIPKTEGGLGHIGFFSSLFKRSFKRSVQEHTKELSRNGRRWEEAHRRAAVAVVAGAIC